MSLRSKVMPLRESSQWASRRKKTTRGRRWLTPWYKGRLSLVICRQSGNFTWSKVTHVNYSKSHHLLVTWQDLLSNQFALFAVVDQPKLTFAKPSCIHAHVCSWTTLFVSCITVVNVKPLITPAQHCYLFYKFYSLAATCFGLCVWLSWSILGYKNKINKRVPLHDTLVKNLRRASE